MLRGSGCYAWNLLGYSKAPTECGRRDRCSDADLAMPEAVIAFLDETGTSVATAGTTSVVVTVSITFGLGHSQSRRGPLQDSSTWQGADGPLVGGSGDDIDSTIIGLTVVPSEKATCQDLVPQHDRLPSTVVDYSFSDVNKQG